MNLLEVVREVRRHLEENGRLPGTGSTRTRQCNIGF